jgi:hypothetical protein
MILHRFDSINHSSNRAGQKKGFLHLIVPKSRFRLGEGSQEALSLYTFGTHTAKHYFCSTCGIGSFYIPRSSASSPPPPLAHRPSHLIISSVCVCVRWCVCVCVRVRSRWLWHVQTLMATRSMHGVWTRAR